MRHDAEVLHREYRVRPPVPMQVAPIERQGAGALHSHNLHELVVVRAGRGLHQLAGRDWPIGPGEVFVVPPRVAHRYRAVDGLALDNLLFAPPKRWLPVEDLAREPGWQALMGKAPEDRPGGRMRLESSELRAIVARIGHVARELQERRTGWAVQVRGEMLLLLAMLVRLWPSRARATPDARLTGVLDYLAEHAHEPLSIQHLAYRCRATPRTLQRQFRVQLGCTPHRYLEDLRFAAAERLLRERPQPIGSVARAVGFTDPSYFARRWRARYGNAPRRMRIRVADA